MNYGEVISRSFSIARHNRFLWFFGVFAGGSGGVNFPSPPSGGGGGGSGGDGGGSSTSNLASTDLGLIVAILAVGLLLVLVLVALSVISHGGLVHSVAAIDRGEERRFGSTFRAGVSTFWRVLGLALLMFGLYIGVLLVIGLPVGLLVYATVTGTDSVAAWIIVIGLVAVVAVLLLIAVFFVLSVIWQLALRELALRGRGIVEALGLGWRLFRSRVGTSLLLALINVGLSIAAAIVLILGALVVGLVAFLPAIVLAFASNTTGAIVAGVIGGVVFLVPLFVAVGAINTFSHAFWTIGYLRLTMPPAPPAPPAGPPMPPGPMVPAVPPAY